MLQRILVSSDCQTAGITASLMQLLDHAEIVPLPFLSDWGAMRVDEVFTQQLAQCDVWVVDHEAFTAGQFQGAEKLPTRIVRLPRIRFNAFHPDLIYLRCGIGGPVVSPHYQSAIIANAWKHGLSVEQTRHLFNPDVYAKLGYHQFWDRAVARLQARFCASGLDFSKFFLPLKRQGVFMHSVNHPRPTALVLLGRLIANQITGDPGVFHRHVEIADTLFRDIWPVYPGVGDSLSVCTSLIWKHDDKSYQIEDFIALCFEQFNALDIEPDHLILLNRTDNQLERLQTVFHAVH
jgi:hypothetical protein